MRNDKKGHFIISSIEHSSILETAKKLETEGYDLDILEVDNKGNINLEMLEKLIREDTKLVSIIAVNNETGVIQDLKQISEIIAKKYKYIYSL